VHAVSFFFEPFLFIVVVEERIQTDESKAGTLLFYEPMSGTRYVRTSIDRVRGWDLGQ